MGIRADQYFWFDGVEDVDQTNWGKFWRGYVPDGIIAGFGQNMTVSANSSGMHVHVAAGEAMVYGVRVFLQSTKVLPVEPAESQPRIDLAVVRSVFLNDAQSYAEIDVKKGTAGSAPAAPSLVQTAAQIWELPLATISVGAGVPTIATVNVTDRRVYSVLPIERGGTGAVSLNQARANLGISTHTHNGTDAPKVPISNITGYGNAALKNIGSATVNLSGISPGGIATVACPGLPAGGLVWIEPVDASWDKCQIASVRYYSHSAGTLRVKATTNPGAISLVVGWLG